MTTVESIKNKHFIGPLKANGTQDVKIYDYKSKSSKVFNASKENADKYIDVLVKTKKTSGKILGISTLIGSLGLTILGACAKNKKSIKAISGLVVGAVTGFASGVFISAMSGINNLIKAQEKYLENQEVS